MYNARDMAVLRGAIEKIPIILSSATPSVESFYNVSIGKYKLVELNQRFCQNNYPYIELIDMKSHSSGKNSWLSTLSIKEIGRALTRNEQVLVFLNRKGYAPLVLCTSCGYRYMCRNCSSWLVLYKDKEMLICHHCNFNRGIPNVCEFCGDKKNIIFCGPGIERVSEVLGSIFPNAEMCLLTGEDKSEELNSKLTNIINGRVNLLIGTQVIAKGHHFPKLKLVIVLDADSGLYGADLRACEKMYQLLHQIGGRSGREGEKGRFYIQTYYPEHNIMQTFKNQEMKSFYREELYIRGLYSYPPFSRMAAILISDKNKDRALQFANYANTQLSSFKDLEVWGPIEASLLRLKSRYRYRLIVKAASQKILNRDMREFFLHYNFPSSIHIKVDIDPYSFN